MPSGGEIQHPKKPKSCSVGMSTLSLPPVNAAGRTFSARPLQCPRSGSDDHGKWAIPEVSGPKVTYQKKGARAAAYAAVRPNVGVDSLSFVLCRTNCTTNGSRNMRNASNESELWRRRAIRQETCRSTWSASTLNDASETDLGQCCVASATGMHKASSHRARDH